MYVWLSILNFIFSFLIISIWVTYDTDCPGAVVAGDCNSTEMGIYSPPCMTFFCVWGVQQNIIDVIQESREGSLGLSYYYEGLG